MPRDDEFGHWTTLEERLDELRDRVVAWQITSPDGFGSIWTRALEIFREKLEREPLPLEASRLLLIEAFEESLSSFDSIWVSSMEAMHGLDIDLLVEPEPEDED